MYERSIGLRNGSRSPMPCVRLSCRKNGWSNWSGLISSQTFSSLVYRLKNPGCSLASFTTSANGFCWLATAAAARGAAAIAGGFGGGRGRRGCRAGGGRGVGGGSSRCRGGGRGGRGYRCGVRHWQRGAAEAEHGAY